MQELLDKFGRKITYLRLAVTDRCNLRCQYCMPAQGIDIVDRTALLSYKEMYRITRVLSELGVNKVRLTGGEPFVRKDFVNFFTYSLKSSNESKVWLTLLRDTSKGDQKELEWLLKELIEIANIFASSILTLKGKK